MRIFAPVLLAAALLLTSCARPAKEPFSYQDIPSVISAELFTDLGAYSVTITSGGAGRDTFTIEYSAPDTISGLKVSVSGTVVTASAGGVTVPVSPNAAKGYLSICGLLRLDPDTINSVTENGESVTVATSSGAYATFEGGSDLPSEIGRSDGSVTLHIISFAARDASADSQIPEET